MVVSLFDSNEDAIIKNEGANLLANDSFIGESPIPGDVHQLKSFFTVHLSLVMHAMSASIIDDSISRDVRCIVRWSISRMVPSK